MCEDSLSGAEHEADDRLGEVQVVIQQSRHAADMMECAMMKVVNVRLYLNSEEKSARQVVLPPDV